MPYFKKSAFFEEAYNSVLNQNYYNIEIIIIYDDHDLTELSFVKKIINNRTNTILIINKKNYGESLGDALENEFTTYGLKNELNKKIQTQIDQYCAGVGQKNKKWCEMKPEGEIKYGF